MEFAYIILLIYIHVADEKFAFDMLVLCTLLDEITKTIMTITFRGR